MALFLLASFPGMAAGQQPSQPTSATPDPRVVRHDERERPLSAEELLQEEIRRFDPLDPSNTSVSKRDSTERDATVAEPEDRKTPALPGSIAEEARNAAKPIRGPRVVGEDEAAPEEEYTGPAVLSRAYTLNKPTIAQDVNWSRSVGINTTFNSGTNAAAPGPAGTVAKTGNLYGTSFSWNLSGRKHWKRDQISGSISGQYQRNYPSNGAYNGPNTVLAIDYSHIITRRLSLRLTESGTMSSQNYSLQNPASNTGTSIANINITSSPNVQTFDTGTKQFSSQVDLIFQKSTRLSYSAGISYFAIIRSSAALIGVTGEQARGDVNYRWSRKTTVGVYYSYSHYLYPKGFGVTDTGTEGLIYSYAFTRTLQLRLRAGFSSAESLGLQSVVLSPLVAALLRRPTLIVDGWRPFKSSDLSGQIVKDFQGGRTVSLAYARGVSPGNGVFQASTQESLALSAASRVRRKYTVQFSVGREQLTSASQSTGSYGGYNAQISAGRSFRGGFASNVQVGFRYFDLTAAQAARDQIQVSSGITWSPGRDKFWPF